MMKNKLSEITLATLVIALISYIYPEICLYKVYEYVDLAAEGGVTSTTISGINDAEILWAELSSYKMMIAFGFIMVIYGCIKGFLLKKAEIEAKEAYLKLLDEVEDDEDYDDEYENNDIDPDTQRVKNNIKKLVTFLICVLSLATINYLFKQIYSIDLLILGAIISLYLAKKIIDTIVETLVNINNELPVTTIAAISTLALMSFIYFSITYCFNPSKTTNPNVNTKFSAFIFKNKKGRELAFKRRNICYSNIRMLQSAVERYNKKNINKKIVNLDINSLEELKETGYIKKIPVCPESRKVTYNGTKMDKNGKVKCGDSPLSEFTLIINIPHPTHGSLDGK